MSLLYIAVVYNVHILIILENKFLKEWNTVSDNMKDFDICLLQQSSEGKKTYLG